MGDLYLLATPVLILAVLSVVRFVGCLIKPPRPHAVSPPSNLIAVPGNQRITLTWDPADIPESQYLVKRGTMSGVYLDALLPVPISETTKVDEPLPNGVRQFYVVVNVAAGGAESPPSNERDAVPGLGLVTSRTLGMLRTDQLDLWAGMLIRIGGSPVTIVGLGRICFKGDSTNAGNTGVHVVKVVNASTNMDVMGAVTSVDLSSPNAVDGEFVYGVLQNPVPLVANTEYYVVSHEKIVGPPGMTTGDFFYDLDTVLQTTAVASVVSAVFGDGVSSYTRGGGVGQAYGPVDILY